MIKENIKSLISYFNVNKKEIVAYSFLAAIMFAVFADIYYLPFALLVAIILYNYLNEKTFIFFSIIILISFTGEAVENLRDYFTILAIIGLTLFFIKKYGLNFNDYPKPPKLILRLWFLFIFTLAFSTIINGFHFAGIDVLFKAIVFFSICYFLYAFLEEKDNKFNHYYLILSLFSASLILSITVYYELISAGFTVFLVEGFFARFAGVYGNFNTLALVISLNVILSIIAIYTENVPGWVKKYFIPFYLINNFFIIFLTNSRAAILALSVALLFLFYHLNKKIILLFVGLVASVLLLYLIDPFTQSLIDAYIRLDTVSQRDYLWAAGIEVMKDYPIFGVGTEMFHHKFYTYVPTAGAYMFDLFRILQKPHPHNYSLWLITENGILGWICAFAIFGFYFYMGFKLIKKLSIKKDEPYYFSLGLTAVGILVFVRSFFEVEGIFSYGYISRDLPFWINYILLGYYYKKYFENQEAQSS
ncbi:MAG: O-antigen ligase family protein [Ignavibacterium sp.]|nr:O-antigen ligase family protein [Ignavibacterium sp.]